MKYIHIPKKYNSLRVHNQQNNDPTSSAAPKLFGQGIRFLPFTSVSAANRLSMSFCIKPTGITELFRLFSIAGATFSQNMTFSDSGVSTSGMGYSVSTSISSRNVSGFSSINVSNVLSNVNEWVTILVTMDGVSATKTLSLYVDGYLFGTISGTSSFSLTTNFVETYFFRNFNGIIRSFQVWNSTFSDQSAFILHNYLVTGTESFLDDFLSAQNLVYNFVFESDKISLGTNEVVIQPNEWISIDPNPPVLNITGTTTLNNTTVSSMSSTVGIVSGMAVSGTNIPIGTFVSSVSTSSIVLSRTATASGTVSNLSFYGRNIWKAGSFFSTIVPGASSSLYVSCDNGATAGYINSSTGSGINSYAYKDVSITSNASVLSLRCFLPRDAAVSDDFIKILVAPTSFTPSNSTAYTASGSTYGAGIIKQTISYAYSSFGGHGRPNDQKIINYDLSDYEGQTVRVIICFSADSGNDSFNSTIPTGNVAIFSTKMIEKSTIQGVVKHPTLGQLIPNGDFEQGTTNWNFANNQNAWVIGQADRYSKSRSLYVSSNDGLSSSYNVSLTSVSHTWTDFTLTDSMPRIKFVAKVGGETSGATTYDALRIRVISNNGNPVSSLPVPVAGTLAISGGTTLHDQEINLTNGWSLREINLSGQFSGSLPVRLVFTWRNDGSSGAQPGAVIDLVSVSNSSGETLGLPESITLPMIFNSAEFSDDKP